LIRENKILILKEENQENEEKFLILIFSSDKYKYNVKCVCVCVCARARARVCVCVCVWCNSGNAAEHAVANVTLFLMAIFSCWKSQNKIIRGKARRIIKAKKIK